MHNRLKSAANQASTINLGQDLSSIEVGLHDEIFQGELPVLVGVDAASTSCYLLEAAEHRDADTWGYHLLAAAEQGLDPTYPIADAGKGLKAGQKAAFGDKPCHGDIFHIQHQCQLLANSLSRQATGATTQRQKLEQQMDEAKQKGRGPSCSQPNWLWRVLPKLKPFNWPGMSKLSFSG